MSLIKNRKLKKFLSLGFKAYIGWSIIVDLTLLAGLIIVVIKYVG